MNQGQKRYRGNHDVVTGWRRVAPVYLGMVAFMAVLVTFSPLVVASGTARTLALLWQFATSVS
jgi:hypothetical protein